MDVKLIFLANLGIIIWLLLYKIVYTNVEGFKIKNPFAAIKSKINSITKAITNIKTFICKFNNVLKWSSSTVGCIQKRFNPLYCIIVHIIDMCISFIMHVIGWVLKLFYLDKPLKAATDAISILIEFIFGIKINGLWSILFPECYTCTFKSFPKI